MICYISLFAIKLCKCVWMFSSLCFHTLLLIVTYTGLPGKNHIFTSWQVCGSFLRLRQLFLHQESHMKTFQPFRLVQKSCHLEGRNISVFKNNFKNTTWYCLCVLLSARVVSTKQDDCIRMRWRSPSDVFSSRLAVIHTYISHNMWDIYVISIMSC